MDMQAKTFNVDKFSDYKVCVKDTIFQVNSVFLAIHSNVFRAYFNHNTRETQTKTIQIDDVDANLVEAMLKYCYSGKVENLAEIAQDLYVLADRYQMEELQVKF
jgi:speckle-type POZ protein